MTATITPERRKAIDRHIKAQGWESLQTATWGEPYRSQGKLILEYGYLTQPPEPGSIKILVLLQNAWINAGHPIYEYLGCWPRSTWLWATEQSYTGKQLNFLLDREDTWFDDATPVVAVGNSSIAHPIDLDYVGAVLATVNPQIVMACGVNAVKAATELWGGRCIRTCHPAYRFATPDLFRTIANLIEADTFDRVTVMPSRGGKTIVEGT